MLPSRRASRRIATSSVPICQRSCPQGTIFNRHYSDQKNVNAQASKDKIPNSKTKSTEEVKPKQKTQAELDQEFLMKMQEHDGDGGVAGVEYEDGKPVSMKRSVKNNMFRYI